MRMSPVRAALLLAVAAAWSVSAQTYTISTFAGGGLPVNIPGTSARLRLFYTTAGIAADRQGNLFFVDQNIVLRLDAKTGLITPVAGNGVAGFSGDNGLATSAQLNTPVAVAVDSAGNLYIADGANQRVRKVSNGVITTVAGGGTTSPYAGMNPVLDFSAPAKSVQLGSIGGLAVNSAGDVYIGDGLILKLSGGVITIVPGVSYPYSAGAITIDSKDSLYAISGFDGERGTYLLKVSNGVVTTLAGWAYEVAAFALDTSDNLYFGFNGFVKKFPPDTTTVLSGGSIVAGNGTYGSGGDNGPATSAQLGNNLSLALDSAGDLYIGQDGIIRKVAAGMIATVVGGGPPFGDGGPAAAAQLSPADVAVDSAGNTYIADDNRIVKVSQGIVTTVAGNGTAGFSGDGGAATSASLNAPSGIAVDSTGNIYIADSANNRSARSHVE